MRPTRRASSRACHVRMTQVSTRRGEFVNAIQARCRCPVSFACNVGRPDRRSWQRGGGTRLHEGGRCNRRGGAGTGGGNVAEPPAKESGDAANDWRAAAENAPRSFARALPSAPADGSCTVQYTVERFHRNALPRPTRSFFWIFSMLVKMPNIGGLRAKMEGAERSRRGAAVGGCLTCGRSCVEPKERSISV